MVGWATSHVEALPALHAPVLTIVAPLTLRTLLPAPFLHGLAVDAKWAPPGVIVSRPPSVSAQAERMSRQGRGSVCQRRPAVRETPIFWSVESRVHAVGAATNEPTSSRLGQIFAKVVWFVRLAYRKLIHRRADFIECGAAAGDHREPVKPFDLAFEVVGVDGYADLLAASPHLSQADIDYLSTVDSKVVVVRDDEKVAAMNWFVRGPALLWITELRRAVTLSGGEHYSCRTFVDPDYRGRALAEHMICGYARGLGRDDRIWGLVMTRNQPSLRFLSRIGWQATGSWTAQVQFGRFSAHHEVHQPRPLPT